MGREHEDVSHGRDAGSDVGNSFRVRLGERDWREVTWEDGAPVSDGGF